MICINFYSGFISKKFDERQSFLNREIKDSMQRVFFADSGSDSSVMKTKWKTYYDSAMNEVRTDLAQLVDHIDYIVKLVGDSYVGIGSDYDGVSSVPVGMEDVTTYPKITDELQRRGYSNRSIKKYWEECTAGDESKFQIK